MRVYDVIKTAEDTYISETSRLIYPGMCWCLKVSAVKGFDFKEKNRKGHPSYKDLVDNIPEFNPEFLKATREVTISYRDVDKRGGTELTNSPVEPQGDISINLFQV